MTQEERRIKGKKNQYALMQVLRVKEMFFISILFLMQIWLNLHIEVTFQFSFLKPIFLVFYFIFAGVIYSIPFVIFAAASLEKPYVVGKWLQLLLIVMYVSIGFLVYIGFQLFLIAVGIMFHSMKDFIIMLLIISAITFICIWFYKTHISYIKGLRNNANSRSIHRADPKEILLFYRVIMVVVTILGAYVIFGASDMIIDLISGSDQNYITVLWILSPILYVFIMLKLLKKLKIYSHDSYKI